MSSENSKPMTSRDLFGFATVCLFVVSCVLFGFVAWGPLKAWAKMHETEQRWERRLIDAQKSLEEAQIDARTKEARAKGEAWARAQETKSETEAILARAKAHKEAAYMLEPYLSRTFLLYRQVEQNKCPVIPETPATKVAGKGAQ